MSVVSEEVSQRKTFKSPFITEHSIEHQTPEPQSLLPVCHRVAQLPKYQVIFHDETISGYVVNQIFMWQRPRLVPSFMKELGIAKKEAEMLALFIINGTYSVNKALHWKKDETWYQVHSMLLKYTAGGYSRLNRHKSADTD